MQNNSALIKPMMSEPETEQSIETEETAGETAAESFSTELREPLWSLISFEKREFGGLSYAEAEAKLAELQAQNVSGLCIITDAAAERIS